jgi:hypothetical protein
MSIGVEPVSLQADAVDYAVDAYVRWREECVGTREAYRRWLSAATVDRMLASCAFVAALDREEAAASVYADAMRRLGPTAPCSPGRARPLSRRAAPYASGHRRLQGRTCRARRGSSALPSRASSPGSRRRTWWTARLSGVTPMEAASLLLREAERKASVARRSASSLVGSPRSS